MCHLSVSFDYGDSFYDLNRFSCLPVIPHGSQAIWLNGKDSGSTTVSRTRKKKNKKKNKTAVSLLSNEIQAVSLNRDNVAASPRVSSPSYFELLETVSPHVQSVFLDKCTVLELSSLAVVSRSLRGGALETMANRSLNVRIGRYKRSKECLEVMVMFIDDISDPSRNMSVEFCSCDGKEYKCQPWTKILKLLLFCGHANVKRIHVDSERCFENMNPPNRFAMRSNHNDTSETPIEEFFVEEFQSHCVEGAQLLNFVSPRVLILVNDGTDIDDYDELIKTQYTAVFKSRGVLSAESITVNFVDKPNFVVINDEAMLKLSARSIEFYAWPDCNLYDVLVWCVRWTPVGISMFIEQWLRGSRVINKVMCRLHMPDEDSIAVFHKDLVEALGKLDPAPQVVSSSVFDDDLDGRLQIVDGKMIYKSLILFGNEDSLDFNRAKAAVIQVTAPDGRKLSIAVTDAWDIVERRRAGFGFIDIFPSDK